MYGGRSNYRDNFGRWQSKVTVNLTKKLIKEAEAMRIDLEKVVADKLKETHKANIEASYYPRARGEQAKSEFNKTKKAEEQEDWEKHQIKSRRSRKKLGYQHTGTLLEAVDTKIEKKNKYESKVSIIINPLTYPDDGHRHADPNPVKATDVYEWLREGTKGGGEYWFRNKEGKRPTAHNYSTPAHLFEMHTSLQMKGFINSLNLKDYANKKKYRKG